MNYYIFTCGILGIGAMLLFSLFIVPIACDSISKDNSNIKCNLGYDLVLLGRIFSELGMIIILGIGFIIGGLVGRTIYTIKYHELLLKEKLERPNKNKRFLWMWEYKKE